MAGKKGSKKAEEPPEPPAPPQDTGWKSWFHPRVLLGLSAVVCAVVFGPRLWSLLPDLKERPEYRLRTAEIQINAPPRWVPEDFAALACEQAGLPRELSLLDENLVSDVAAALRKQPWVAEVVQVRKTVPAGLVAEVKYRQPVAVVEVSDGLYPVDRMAILLPPADLAPAEARRYPRIQNVGSRPSGPAGTAWGDVAVVGGARLAAVLLETTSGGEPAWKRYGLTAIRVPARSSSQASLDDVMLELVTAGGSRVLWGRPPGSTHPGELSVDQKLGRLDKYVKDYGGFDQPHGPYEIDIRHWQEISRRGLASAPGRQRH